MNVYGLIGFPLGHSFSKEFFTQKFSKESITDSVFELFPIYEIEQLRSLLQSVPGLKGLSVTIPHKETIIPFLDKQDLLSQEIGAVNCVQVKEGKLYGYNTDVIGFERSFLPLCKSHHQKALVLGNGGASKAVKFVLNKHKISFCQVSRNTNASSNSILYRDVNESIMKEYTAIINCTPLGMHPEIDSMPYIPYQYVSPDHLMYDLVYNPVETKFLKKGKEFGAVCKNGYEMLQLQAEESWKIWNDL